MCVCVAILILDLIRFQHSDVEADPHGRYIFIKGYLDGQMYTLGCIYAPNSTQEEFLKEIFVKLSCFQGGYIIVGGDLNIVIHDVWDHTSGGSLTPQKLSGKSHSLPVKGVWGHLIEKFKLLDSWRIYNPSGRNYTFKI